MFLIALLIPIVVVIMLRIPVVKQFVIKEATDFTSELISYPVTIGNIEIDWYDHIILQNVVLKDREENDMIFLGEGIIDFSFYKLIRGDFQIENCTVRDGGVNLYVFEKDSIVNINEFVNTLQAKFSNPNDTTKSAPFVFTIPYAKLKNMSFRYDDQTVLFYKPGFDERHFGFDSVYSYVEQFEIRSDTIQLTTHKLRAVEFRSKKQIHELNTFFRFHKTGMHFENAYAHIGNSTINAEVHFAYDSIRVLTEFNTQVQMRGKLDNCHIKVQDLAIFSPTLFAYHDNYIISGEVSGTVNRLKGKNLELCFGKNSYFKGSANLKNLPSIDDLFLDCSAKSVLIDIPDLKQYVENDIYNDIIKLRYFDGKGKFVGFFHDFTTQGTYHTGLGKIDVDLFLNRPEIGERNPMIKLSGRLETTNFRIGELIDHPAAESISIKGEMIGEGKNLANASVNIDAFISSFIYAGYNYHNITTRADLSNRLFKGYAAINDSNLVASLDGTIDFREELKLFNFKLLCDKANLHKMNLGSETKFPLLRTSASLNARVLNINELEGSLHTGQTYLLYPDNKEVFIDSIHAEVIKEDDEKRVFTLQSDLIDGNITGNFDFIGLQQSLITLGEEALLKINNDQQKLDHYYSQKTDIGQKQQADFQFLIKDLNQFFDIYIPGTFMSPNSTLQGHYNANEEQNNLSIHFLSDTLFYNFYEFRGNSLKTEISKHPYQPYLTTQYDLTSASQKLKRMVPTKNLSVKGHTKNDSLFMSSSIEQDGMNNKIVLNNTAVFLKDQTDITFENSYIQIDDEQWDVNPKGQISLTKDGDIQLKEVNLQYQKQHLHMDGWISKKTDEKLNININNFNINTILTFITTIPINGLINGDIILSDILDAPNFHSDIEVYGLEIDSVVIGDMEGNSLYNKETKKIELDFDLYKDYSTIASITGFLNTTSGSNDDIDLTINMSKTDLAFLNPLLEGILENIEGEATGKVKIKGPYSDPEINGETYIEKGRFKIPYLGTTYAFNDKIIFNDNMIGFQNVNLKDQFGENCLLNGGIFHDLFQNFVFNLNGEMDNFYVLNTTEKDNSIFYGRAFGTGHWELLGSENDIRITADATMLRTSKIYIPMNSYEDVEEKDYITFIKHEEKDKLLEKKINLSGIIMDININIEPGTYSEIIFDKAAGDIIKSYGRGSLKFNIDTRGDFSMYGNYIIEKGSYNFTLANIINKEFKIVNGSRISWTGSPYDGILNIDATYQQYVPLSPIITSTDTLVRNSADAKRRTPVDLDMKLTGQLTHPEVELGIHILNKYPSSLSSYVTAFENQLQTNPSELNRQVFSLLLFRQFSPANEFTGVGGATQNLNELLSNQLSMWLSQVDPNLQIQVDLTQLSQSTGGNNFNMRFSYTLLDGRLRVSMDGLVAGSQNNKNTGTQNNSNSNVIGEWTLEYFLTQDGKLRLKLFNRANQNSVISSTSSNVANSTGFSVTHTQEFDNLGELFGRKSKKEKTTDDMKNQMIIKREDEPQDTILIESPLEMPENIPDSK